MTRPRERRYHGCRMLSFPLLSIFALQLLAHDSVGRIGKTPFNQQPPFQPIQ